MLTWSTEMCIYITRLLVTFCILALILITFFVALTFRTFLYTNNCNMSKGRYRSISCKVIEHTSTVRCERCFISCVPDTTCTPAAIWHRYLLRTVIYGPRKLCDVLWSACNISWPLFICVCVTLVAYSWETEAVASWLTIHATASWGRYWISCCSPQVVELCLPAFKVQLIWKIIMNWKYIKFGKWLISFSSQFFIFPSFLTNSTEQSPSSEAKSLT
jgi:hypothetical protein